MEEDDQYRPDVQVGQETMDQSLVGLISSARPKETGMTQTTVLKSYAAPDETETRNKSCSNT